MKNKVRKVDKWAGNFEEKYSERDFLLPECVILTLEYS